MTRKSSLTADAALARIFPGDSELAGRMRAMDWSKTDLGPPSGWPENLRTSVSICLTSRFPIVLWWGPNLTLLYNDAYTAVMGPGKHPQWLGRSGRECWAEIWDTIGPMLEGVMRDGNATWSEELPLILNRHLPQEEDYFTFSYSPILSGDASKVEGIFCAVTETTDYVLSRRRLSTLRELGLRTIKLDTVDAAAVRVAEVLEANPRDVPFAAIYYVDTKTREARLVASVRVADGLFRRVALRDAASPWPIARVWDERKRAEVPFGPPSLSLKDAPWPEPPAQLSLVPAVVPGFDGLGAVLAFGVSSRRPFDAGYRAFLHSVAAQLGTAMAEASANEAERRRAESLAEIDRAKTAFFSNVSHEFRTPLTLMLGALEDTLESPDLPASERHRLDVAHRNSLRLLRLVNTLLDFSRIEAGRAEASYEPVDVAQLTAEFASSFHSAIERAGLSFDVRCRATASPVFVDHDMWEKVVLNLLSNAFKFTLEGGVTVELEERDGFAELSVRDTGVGIPPEEVPHVFERFHRVKGTEGRTHEGTGIGLALVSELVKLHGGVVGVASELGRGSTFTVRIPTGTAHLPQERIGAKRRLASTSLGAAPFVEEALRWLPGSELDVDRESSDVPIEGVTTRGARVLVADDNADMRGYLTRLLGRYWIVEPVADGEEALAALRRQRPALVLSDAMMPRLDGIGLVRAIRADSALRSLPVILLSARAGEESRVEGVGSGADDYVTKPFSARELTARINAHLEMALVREAAAAEREALLQRATLLRAQAEEANRAKDEFLAVLSHELRSPLNAMLGWVRILRTAGGRDPELASRAAETLERNIWLQSQVINDLLDVSRIVSGKLELDLARVDLTEVVASCVESLRVAAVGKQIELRLDLRSDPLDVMGDGARLQQVVSNLVGNAIKFTEAGGRVTVSLERGGRSVRVDVEDTGQGIAPEFMPHLFERFRQADGSTSRRHGGLGLGLAIVKNIVRLHGGEVTAESAGPGRGARFSVVLPVAERRHRVAFRAPAVPDPRPESLRALDVLIVEDDNDSRHALALAVAELGATVRSVDSALLALQAYEARRPDVVISDIGMPGQDGYALVRAIREREGDGAHRTLAIAMTGLAGREDRETALHAGFDEHVAKPVAVDAFLERVSVLAASLARQERRAH